MFFQISLRIFKEASDDQQNDDPAAVPAATTATVITAHIGTSYEIEM